MHVCVSYTLPSAKLFLQWMKLSYPLASFTWAELGLHGCVRLHVYSETACLYLFP